jgi:hypothetical protein
MKRADIESAIYFLTRVVPRGEQETDELFRAVAALQHELAKRAKGTNENATAKG